MRVRGFPVFKESYYQGNEGKTPTHAEEPVEVGLPKQSPKIPTVTPHPPGASVRKP